MANDLDLQWDGSEASSTEDDEPTNYLEGTSDLMGLSVDDFDGQVQAAFGESIEAHGLGDTTVDSVSVESVTAISSDRRSSDGVRVVYHVFTSEQPEHAELAALPTLVTSASFRDEFVTMARAFGREITVTSISLVNIEIAEICPTPSPTLSPTAPTGAPTVSPTASPTSSPTDAPTTASPTASPTAPTEVPTRAPTEEGVTWSPTDAPTAAPTGAPTPTSAPTAVPTDIPTTGTPTDAPTEAPTILDYAQTDGVTCSLPRTENAGGATYDGAKYNCDADPTCAGIYDDACDGTYFTLCDAGYSEESVEAGCMYRKPNLYAQTMNVTCSTARDGSESTWSSAKEACEGDATCAGIVDEGCDNSGFALCDAGYSEAEALGSCLYQKPTMAPTASPTAPTQAPTTAPTAPTNAPTTAPTAAPTSPTETPTAAPTAPTNAPTVSPTAAPTSPTDTPTAAPTAPTGAPTAAPTAPTGTPTATPTAPIDVPTAAPTAPTGTPTAAPTSPTDVPTAVPTGAPTAPTDVPTAAPTAVPTSPTSAPTETPTSPTTAPTDTPTDAPTSPTEAPTTAPTDTPTASPTEAPTDAPTTKLNITMCNVTAARRSGRRTTTITGGPSGIQTSGGALITTYSQDRDIGLGTADGSLHIDDDELGRLDIQGGLTVGNSNSGSIRVGGVSDASTAGIDSLTLVATKIMKTVTFSDDSSAFNHGVTVMSAYGIRVGESITADGPLTLNAGLNDPSGEKGVVTVAVGKALQTTGHAVVMTAVDLDLSGRLASEGATTTIHTHPNTTLALGDTTGGMHLSDDELGRLTSDAGITIGGPDSLSISVSGLTSASNDNTGEMVLVAAEQVSFSGTASSFAAGLTIQAGGGIVLQANVTTGSTPSTFDAGSGPLTLEAGVLLDSSDSFMFLAAGTHCDPSTGWLGIQTFQSCSLTCNDYEYMMYGDGEGGDGNCKCANSFTTGDCTSTTSDDAYNMYTKQDGVGTALVITADDLVMDDGIGIHVGLASLSIVGSDGETIGMGDASGNMTIDNSELQKLSSYSLTIGSDGVNAAVTIGNVSAESSGNIGGLFTVVATRNEAQAFHTLCMTTDVQCPVSSCMCTSYVTRCVPCTGDLRRRALHIRIAGGTGR